MKKMKKLLSLVLSVVMVVAMGVTVFADGAYKITIEKAMGTYKVYQVFKGDLVTKDGNKVLSNVDWGEGVEKFTYKIGQNEDGTDKMSDNAAEIAEYLSGKGDTEAKAFATEAAKHVKTVAVEKSVAEGKQENLTIDGLTAGYYVVLNSDVASGQEISRYILQVVGDATVENKANTVSSEKKVKDTNDTTGETTGWQDSADYDIGDEVPFQLTGTVSSKYDDYKAYKFTFHDQESEGLTFNKDSVVVKVDDKVITSGYEVVINPTYDKDTFDVVFADLKKIDAVHAGSTITVEYTARLNDKAVIGSTGNPNTMHLEYSNNPNDAQGGETGTTPEDKVIVFTYKTVINKVDQNGNPLTGAEFTLEKKIKGENGAEDTWTPIQVVKNEKGTTFTFAGLDDGQYRLTETTTPSGYNTIDPIEFTITAEHDVLSDNPGLTKLNGNQVTGEITFTKNETEGSLTANVVNKSGSTLPSTGGIGTTIFYVIGGILMVGAGVILISRKRTNK